MDLQSESYDPNGFIDWLVFDVYKVRNDAALARHFGIGRVTFSRIRRRIYPVPPAMFVWVQEKTGLNIRYIRARLMRSGVNIDAAHSRKAA